MVFLEKGIERPKHQRTLFMAVHWNDGTRFVETRLAEGNLWSTTCSETDHDLLTAEQDDQLNAAATVGSEPRIGTFLRGVVRLEHLVCKSREV